LHERERASACACLSVYLSVRVCVRVRLLVCMCVCVCVCVHEVKVIPNAQSKKGEGDEIISCSDKQGLKAIRTPEHNIQIFMSVHKYMYVHILVHAKISRCLHIYKTSSCIHIITR